MTPNTSLTPAPSGMSLMLGVTETCVQTLHGQCPATPLHATCSGGGHISKITHRGQDAYSNSANYSDMLSRFTGPLQPNSGPTKGISMHHRRPYLFSRDAMPDAKVSRPSSNPCQRTKAPGRGGSPRRTSTTPRRTSEGLSRVACSASAFIRAIGCRIYVFPAVIVYGHGF